MLTRSTLNLIALIGMMVTAFLATALVVCDANPGSPSPGGAHFAQPLHLSQFPPPICSALLGRRLGTGSSA